MMRLDYGESQCRMAHVTFATILRVCIMACQSRILKSSRFGCITVEGSFRIQGLEGVSHDAKKSNELIAWIIQPRVDSGE